jgi:hypothetical protein
MLEWRVLKDSAYSKWQEFRQLAGDVPPGNCWVRAWPAEEQSGDYKGCLGCPLRNPSPYLGMKLHVLGDAEYMSYAYSVISVWRRRGRDSLEYVAACRMPALLANTMPVITLVTVFPDGSLMVVAEIGWGDAEDVSKTILFLKEMEPCAFERFHTIEWKADYNRRNNRRVFLDFHHVYYPSLMALQVTEYFSARLYDNRGRPAPDPVMVIDSARAEPLDLWKLAVEHFEIDTTALRQASEDSTGE